MENDNIDNTRELPTQDVSKSLPDPESLAKKANLPKTTSSAKVAANRRNACKSTGPRTQAGKARSRWNAVQHGLLAKRLFTPEESDRAAFTDLLESLREDCQPDGTLEEMLVERMAVGYYRLHVAYGYEAEYSTSPRDYFLTIDKTGRYATSIHRQFIQDMLQFERLHRQREGEFVPAPITVDVTLSSLDDALDNVGDSSGTSGFASMGPDVPHLPPGSTSLTLESAPPAEAADAADRQEGEVSNDNE